MIIVVVILIIIWGYFRILLSFYEISSNIITARLVGMKIMMTSTFDCIFRKRNIMLIMTNLTIVLAVLH